MHSRWSALEKGVAAFPNAPNAVWAGPVSALRWVPLSVYAADGKPETCSRGHAVQWVWGIVRWGSVDFIRTRYRLRRFSTSVQEIWRIGDIHWPMDEDARVDHCPFTTMLKNHKEPLTVLFLLSASELQIYWHLQCSDKLGLQIVV